jgi:hypothetical protein
VLAETLPCPRERPFQSSSSLRDSPRQ